MKIHHFNGIYQERWGFSWAMLVSGRVFHIWSPGSSLFSSYEVEAPTPTLGNQGIRVDQLLVLGMVDLPPLMTGILIMGPYKPLRNWVEFPIRYYMENNGSLDPGTYKVSLRNWVDFPIPYHKAMGVDRPHIRS